MKPIDATNEHFHLIHLFGNPALFTSIRLDRKTIPNGLYAYDIRHADDNGFEAAGIKPFVMVNHMGTVVIKDELEFEQIGEITMDTIIEDGDFEFSSLDGLTLQNFIDNDFEIETTNELDEGMSL